MKLIITGIGGLLGGPLARMAREHGHQVTGVARRADPGIAAEVDDLVVAELADPSARQLDWRRHAGATVIHLAGETRIHASRDFERDNLATTATACGIARQVGGRLVFLSSAAVYSGPVTNYPVRRLHESDNTNSVSAYGRSKKAAEDLIRKRMTNAVILRLFSVLSPRLAAVSDRGHLLQAILGALVTGEPMVIRVDRLGRTAVRDYMWEGDVTRGILAAVAMPRTKAVLTINLCTDVATDTREMVAAAAEAAGREIPLRFALETGAANPVMVGDTGLRRALLGGAPPSRVREFWQELLVADEASRPDVPGQLIPKG